jgi:hypothetical protein
MVNYPRNQLLLVFPVYQYPLPLMRNASVTLSRIGKVVLKT